MSIGRKFALWIVAILMALSAATAYVFYTIELREETAKLDLFGRMAGRIIEESLITFMQRRDTPGLNRKLDDVKASAETVSGILLLNRDGVVKAATDKGLINRKFGIYDTGCRECHEKGSKGLLTMGGSAYRWASPIENKPACQACHLSSVKNNGVLIIDFSVAEFKQHVREELLKGFIVFGSSILLMGITMVLVSRALITRRLERMGSSMRSFQDGMLSASTPVEGRDEITKLETGFNEMAQSITSRERQKNELVDSLNTANEQLQREIAQRMRWERMQQEQLQFLQHLIDTIPMPVFYKDLDGVYLGCNRGFLEYFGLKKDNVVGKTVYDVAPRELADKYHRMDKELFDQPGVQGYEYSVRSADGTIREVIANKATYTDAAGQVAGLVGVLLDITDRKRLEQKLAQGEAHLRAVIDTEPECVKIVAADGTLLEMNPAGLAMIEADSFDQVAGQSMSSLVVPEHRPSFEALAEKTFRGESGMLEFEIAGLKGTRRWLETHTAPLRNAQGNIFALLGVTRDITDRKRAEQVIRRNYDAQTAVNWILHISLEEIPLEAVLKQALDLILSIPWLSLESKGSIFLVQDAPNNLVMKVQRGLADDLREVCRLVPFGKCLCGRAAARGEVQFADTLDDRHEILYEGIVPHGHYCVPIMYAKTVLGVINLYLKEGHQRDQREVEFLSAIADALAGIIQRKRAEAEREKLIGDLRNVLSTLSRSHKEWQDTFDSITDMIAIVDRNFTILKANRAFSAYYGLEPQAVINRKCHEIVHDGDLPAPNCPHTMTVNEARSSAEEFYDKKAKKMFRIFTFPYNSPEGEVIGSIHVMRDITDDKEKEMRLIMSERLAALGQMASGIAHEINNPLASIAGCSEGLLSRVRKGQCDTSLFESYLNIIQEEVFRCKSITTAMLSFVRKTTYEKKDINLAEALNKTIEIIGFQGRMKNVEVVKKYQEPMPMVRGNEGELRQVLLVVITNALDAMHDKGTLTIETESGDGGAVLRISDTGAGISPEIIARIFDPFFTTKSELGGTGLGLSIARKIVTNHNGRIEASSAPGQGTTFTITLPQ
jgi:PAS domain S-box-containing protein